MAYLDLTKKDFSQKLGRVVNSYRSGTRIIGEAKNFILSALKLSSYYSKSAHEPNVEIYIKNWQCGPRKVKMIVLKLETSKEIPVPKQKLIDSLYPPKPRSNRGSLEKQYAIRVRAVMRQLIDYQLRDFRKSINYPSECWETRRQITAASKIDIDHINKPFIQLADEWLVSLGLTYKDIELVGPPNLKKFKVHELNSDWKSFHFSEARLAPVLSSVNRSKGSGDYETPEHLYGSLKPESPDEIDLEF